MKKQKLTHTGRKRKYELFRDLFNFWSVKLGFGIIPVERDNRFNAHAVTFDYGKGDIKIVYNVKKLAKWNMAEIVCGVFHELGHVKNGLKYDTDEQMIESEYQAERFALRMIKKHYPKYLKDVVLAAKKTLACKEWRDSFPIHYQAFSKIKEYK